MKRHFIRVAQALGIGILVLALSESHLVAILIGGFLLVVVIILELVLKNSVFKMIISIVENSFLATAPAILFLRGEQLVQVMAASYLLGMIWLVLILFDYYARKEKEK